MQVSNTERFLSPDALVLVLLKKIRIKVIFKNRYKIGYMSIFFPDQTLCTKGEKRGENVYDERTYFFMRLNLLIE